MARNAITDLLQVNSFWLMDVAPIDQLAVPVLTPLFGFSSISAPELTLETYDVGEANALFRKKVIKKGEVSNVTLTRGITFYDSDFWRWTMAALRGSTTGADLGLTVAQIGGVTPRRDLVLIQYFRRNPFGVPAADGSQSVVATALQAAASAGVLAGAAASRNSAAALGALVSAAGVAASPVGPFSTFAKLPARAWLLTGCLPVRYKPGSDFDASSGEVSVAELDVAVEGLEEISLAAT